MIGGVLGGTEQTLLAGNHLLMKEVLVIPHALSGGGGIPVKCRQAVMIGNVLIREAEGLECGEHERVVDFIKYLDKLLIHAGERSVILDYVYPW